MPTAKELLDALEEDETEEGESGEEVIIDSANTSIKAIRESQKKWEKQAKDLAKALKVEQERVLGYETKERVTALSTAFGEVELPDNLKAFVVKHYTGDATLDAVKQYLVDEGLSDVSGTAGTTEEKSKGFEPGGVGGASPGHTYSAKEAVDMAFDDPERYARLRASGALDNVLKGK